MFVGKIWEARLYDRALNHSEVESSFLTYQHGFQFSAIPELLDAQELGEWRKLDARSKEHSMAWEAVSHDMDGDPELQH